MKRKLEGKVALVTGGTTGIGLAAAKLFHAEGAKVIVTGKNPMTLEQARASLRGIAEVVASDSGDGAEIGRLFARIAEQYGGLDVLFLNAGIVRRRPRGRERTPHPPRLHATAGPAWRSALADRAAGLALTRKTTKDRATPRGAGSGDGARRLEAFFALGPIMRAPGGSSSSSTATTVSGPGSTMRCTA